MFKYLLIFLVFWCKSRARECTIADTSRTRTDSSEDPPCPPTTSLFSSSEPIKKPLTMNGRNNYYVGQQILYVGDSQFFTRLLNNTGSFRSGNTSTHKYYPFQITWNEARQACIREGGHLAIIDSESEERILLHMLKENKVNSAWLGLHDLFEEGDWVSVLDQNLRDFKYVRWAKLPNFPYQPDNWLGNQNCAAIVKEGGMDDYDCKSKAGFFCEIIA